MRTGYFARARSATHDARHTKTHLFDDGKGKCLCGHKPHPTMSFQWCANGVQIEYVECGACKEKYLQSISHEAIMCAPLRKGMTFTDGNGGFLTVQDSSIQGIKYSAIDSSSAVVTDGPLRPQAFRMLLVKKRFRPIERFEKVRHHI